MTPARGLNSGPLPSSGRNDALDEDEAAIEPALAGLHHGIGFFRALIEGEALDGAHGPRPTLGPVD